MTTFDDLLQIAYRKERVISRRLARHTGLSEDTALRKTLEQVAEGRSLAVLIAERMQEKNARQAKIAARKQEQASVLANKAQARQPDPHAWLAWFDGATHPNPGRMGIGGLLKSPDGNITRISFYAGLGDSSEAEYVALIAILEAAIKVKPGSLVIYGDSQVVINDVNAMHGASALAALREQAKRLMGQLNQVVLCWVPRARNTAADALSQQAITALTSGQPERI